MPTLCLYGENKRHAYSLMFIFAPTVFSICVRCQWEFLQALPSYSLDKLNWHNSSYSQHSGIIHYSCKRKHSASVGTAKWIALHWAVLAFALVAFALSAHSQTSQDTVFRAMQDSIRPARRGFITFPARVLPNGTYQLRNAPASFARKLVRGSLFIFGMEGLGFAGLAALNPKISGWASGSFDNYRGDMQRAFTSPPVFDQDKWYFNYIGHPYAGAAYYNAVRSQNAKIWQSSVFCLAHVLLWEYVIESGLEQPSIQDLIVTPLSGIVLGELVHRGTMAMARNGFKWYEVAAVVVFNPMFMFNNGFRFARPKPK